MYQIVSAEAKHLDQITPLLMTTGYWDAALQENLLGLIPYDFMRQHVALPHLPFTRIIIENGNDSKVLGVIVCASNEETDQLPDHMPLMSPQAAGLFSAFSTFKMPRCYHISFLAVAKEYRGKGLGTMLIQSAEKSAKEKGYDVLSLFVFSCLADAIKLYLKMGMTITQTLTLSNTLPCNIVLYFEKSKKLTEKMRNCFE